MTEVTEPRASLLDFICRSWMSFCFNCKVFNLILRTWCLIRSFMRKGVINEIVWQTSSIISALEQDGLWFRVGWLSWAWGETFPQEGFLLFAWGNLTDGLWHAGREFHETSHSVTFYFMTKRLPMMLWYLNARVNSHQRWKQTRFRVCFHLWCKLTQWRS